MTKKHVEICRFKVEDPSLRIVSRYRIVKGVHDLDSDCVTYWIETWLPDSKRWVLTYLFFRRDSIDKLLLSSEYKALLRIY